MLTYITSGNKAFIIIIIIIIIIWRKKNLFGPPNDELWNMMKKNLFSPLNDEFKYLYDEKKTFFDLPMTNCGIWWKKPFLVLSMTNWSIWRKKSFFWPSNDELWNILVWIIYL